MKDLKQNIIDALSDATDFEYDKVNTSIFYEYLDDIFDQTPDNEYALIKRNEELEAMLEEYQRCRNYKDDEWKEAIDGFRKLDKKITELLNK